MKKIAVMVLSTLICSCAIEVFPLPSGGNKTDGIIEMSYTIYDIDRPIINWNNVDALAEKKCENWRYENAEAFGGQRKECISFDVYQGSGACNEYQVIIPYQCFSDKK